jgi:hypothetical protein
MSAIEAYPLQWPLGRPRCKPFARRRAKFRTARSGPLLSVAVATMRLTAQLRMAKASDVVISSNLLLRNDGQPRSGQSEPTDPGVAVYYKRKGKPGCISVDCWDRSADNIAAIAQIVNAIRTMERLGGGEIVDQVFTGFKALPSPDGVVVDVDTARAFIEARGGYKAAAMQLHPDRTGNVSNPDWLQLQRAKAILDAVDESR